MKQKGKNTFHSFIGFFITATLLGIVQLKVERPIILAERFFAGGGWLTIIVLSCYSAFLIYQMKDPQKTAIWRKRSWLFFSFVFFSQLLLGISGFEKFLMTGKLHFPIPALIIGGPVYRMQLSFMPVLFLTTVVISGPAWCSQLCYFGAFDLWASSARRPVKSIIQHLWTFKYLFLLLVIFTAIILRISGASNLIASVFSVIFGLTGISIIIFLSPKQGKMVHCVAYCPIGTLVRFLKLVNPFRMYIDSQCNNCLACISTCRYDALHIQHIKDRKPGPTCTYCGDCVASCKSLSIRYKFFSLKPETARMIWIILTVSLHAVFMGLARI